MAKRRNVWYNSSNNSSNNITNNNVPERWNQTQPVT